ncbi:Serine protease htra2, mitochondrial [Aphanomyces cochlioides]|nr:Serine protease htra2, mitochondrial [Aphanomyces cochlioides]
MDKTCTNVCLRLTPGNDMTAHMRSSQAYLSRNFIADAVEKAAPSVVNITIYSGQMPSSSGSGFIIESTGLIITNAHVVANTTRASSIMVTLANGTKYSGHVHSVDNLSDLALIQLDGSPTGLNTMEIGSSSTIRAGEWVIALGSPLSLQNSVSAGIVSAISRHSSELGFSNKRNQTEYIQTDAAINVGNSGGPLVNLDGQVIGINTMKLAGGPGITGISFAIPIDTAMEIVGQLKKHKSVARPYVGMQMIQFGGSVLPEVSKLNPDLPQGVVVKSVTPGSPAAVAGIQTGDVILEFAGTKITSIKDIMAALGFNVGRKMCMKIRRNGNNDPLTICFVTKDASTVFGGPGSVSNSRW